MASLAKPSDAVAQDNPSPKGNNLHHCLIRPRTCWACRPRRQQRVALRALQHAYWRSDTLGGAP
eukprot:12905302-Heterocapsa_arctica.AAC.1